MAFKRVLLDFLGLGGIVAHLGGLARLKSIYDVSLVALVPALMRRGNRRGNIAVITP